MERGVSAGPEAGSVQAGRGARAGHVGRLGRVRRVLIGVYAGCGVALVPWTGVLVAQLHGQAGKLALYTALAAVAGVAVVPKQALKGRKGLLLVVEVTLFENAGHGHNPLMMG